MIVYMIHFCLFTKVLISQKRCFFLICTIWQANSSKYAIIKIIVLYMMDLLHKTVAVANKIWDFTVKIFSEEACHWTSLTSYFRSLWNYSVCLTIPAW